MFGTEPVEKLTPEEIAEFERHASARLEKCARNAYWAGGALALNIALIVPFSDGYSLHRYWRGARFLIFTADALLVWFVIAAVTKGGRTAIRQELTLNLLTFDL